MLDIVAINAVAGVVVVAAVTSCSSLNYYLHACLQNELIICYDGSDIIVNFWWKICSIEI